MSHFRKISCCSLGLPGRETSPRYPYSDCLLESELDRFGPRIRAVVVDPANKIFVSTVTIWEIAIKVRLEKLTMKSTIEALPTMIERAELSLLSMTADHAIASALPEPPTKDPFDRMLLAQCAVEGFKLVTIDRALVDHPMSIKLT